MAGRVQKRIIAVILALVMVFGQTLTGVLTLTAEATDVTTSLSGSLSTTKSFHCPNIWGAGASYTAICVGPYIDSNAEHDGVIYSTDEENSYHYSTVNFTPAVTGNYTFEVTSASLTPVSGYGYGTNTNATDETVMFIYMASGFDPTTPLAGLMYGQNDIAWSGTFYSDSNDFKSKIASGDSTADSYYPTVGQFQAGTTYTLLIVSGFDNVSGTINVAITGPGSVSISSDDYTAGGGTNTAPTATAVSVDGTAAVGQTLTGKYTYGDADSNDESGTTYKWYRATDNTGTGAAEISDATTKTYGLTSDDLGKYVCFEVTPSDGTDSGTAVKSSYAGPVTAASSAWDGTTTDTTWYTANTAATSFTIHTEEELAGFASIVNAGTDTFSGDTVTLAADLDLGGRQWTPIGKDDTNCFSGIFDGGSHTISNLTIGTSGSPNATFGYAGLFGYVYCGTITDVGLIDVSIFSSYNAGGLAGYWNGTVGIATPVTNCYATGSVSAAYYYAGGLIGKADYCSASNCFAAVDVTGGSGTSAGGLLGQSGPSNTSVTSCYATGNVTASGNNGCAGGLIGIQTGTKSSAVNCYATGSTTVLIYKGGLIGCLDGGTVTACYYNISAGTTEGVGGGIDSTTAKTSTEMKDAGFVTTLNTGYSGVWAADTASTNQGYPVLTVFPAAPASGAPTLTVGTAGRTSDTAATVKFTTNEAGTYYYGVVGDGESAPTINTDGMGISCTAGEVTISVTSLTAGAKDIYIKVKDADGNVSDALKMDIAAYVAPVLTVGGYGIYTSGTPVIIAAGTSGTLIYYDADADGELDTGETPMAISGPTGNTTTGYDLGNYDIYGAALAASVASSKITMLSGTVSYIFGSGHETYNNVTGNADITVKGGTVRMVYGGGSGGSVGGNTNVTMTGGTVLYGIIGSCSGGSVSGDTNITITGGAITGASGIEGNVYGGGFGGTVSGNTNVTITGGTIDNDVYGGGYGGTVSSSANVTLTGGTIGGNVYGGGWGGSVTGTATVTVGVDIGITGTVTSGCSQESATVGTESKVIYEVAFYDESGGTKYDSGSQYPPQWITAGEKAAKPATDPTQTGLTFSGWKKASDNTTYNFDSTVSAATKLYAGWIGIELGNATVTGGKYYYKDAEVTGDGFRTILIGFSKSVVSGDKITLPTAPTGFTVSATSNDYTKRINLAEGTSTSAVQSYLRDVGFAIASANQTMTVTVTTENITTDTFYNIDTEHYYQFIPAGTSGINWVSAYNAAKSLTYMGRTGYLATVMTLGEDTYLNSLSGGKTGWLGGTILTNSGTRVNADGTAAAGGLYYSLFSTTSVVSGTNVGWYWACGPEIGTKFYNVNSIKDVSGATEAAQAATADAANPDTYYNWSRTGAYEPNNANGDENCLTTLILSGRTGKQGTIFTWNDIAYNNTTQSSDFSAKGYFVEYGNQTKGDNGSGSATFASASGELALLSTDATLKTSSTVKGKTVSLGTPNSTLGSETAGSVTLTAAQAADTSNAGDYITLFDKNNADAAVKVVKYASGASTANFASDAAYANEAVSNGDFFIVKVTAQDGATVNYYRINVTVTVTVELTDITWKSGSTYTCGIEMSSSCRMVTISVDSGYFTVPSLGGVLTFLGGTNGTTYMDSYTSGSQQFGSAVFSFTDVSAAETQLGNIIYSLSGTAQQEITATVSTVSPLTGDIYFEGHFYHYVVGSIDWVSAALAAGGTADPYFGGRGYLATATSQAENSILLKLVDTGGTGEDHWNDAWMGGLWQRNTGTVASPSIIRGTNGNEITYSNLYGTTLAQQKNLLVHYATRYTGDATCSGTEGSYIYQHPETVLYYWLDGPEAGQEIANNVTDGFSPWHSGEPNSGDFVYIGWMGAYWDDFGAYNGSNFATQSGYIVEFSGFGEGGSVAGIIADDTNTVGTDATGPAVTDKTITSSDITRTGATLSWNKATDDRSAQTTLKYLVYRSSSNNLGTVADIETNGTALGSYTADIATKAVTGLTAGTTYYFNVIVQDEAGNKTCYTTKSVTTLPPLSAALTPTTALTEENLNTNSITVALSNVTFKDATLDPTNFTLNNAPAGVSIESVEYTDTTHCKVNLAYSGTDFDSSVTTFSLTIAAVELSEEEELTSSAITITALVETAPTVTTDSVTTYTATTATLGGNVTASGGETVTERGVVYSSTDSTPEIGELGVTKDDNGTGTGAFSEKTTGLAQGTKYYVRAYAINIMGTSYGSVAEFTTPTITAALTPAEALTEENLNTNSFTVALSNVAFTDATLDPANFTLNNAPAGVSIESVEYTDTTHCKVNLAYSGTDFDSSVTTFSLTIAAAELSEGGNLTSGAITITALVETAPVLTTDSVTTYTATTATLGGNVTASGGESVTERGVVYSSTDSTPEIGESSVTKNENGTGTGAFSEKITGLAQGTKYYVRAYATNIEGTAYGTTEEFTTPTITAALTPAEALTEENLNTNSLTVTLSNVTFTDATLDPASFTLNNAPAGVSIESVEYTDTTHCKVNLAYDDTDFDADATTFSLTIAVAELSEGEDLTSGAITIADLVETAPVLTTDSVTTYTATTATLGGNVTASGGESVTERGVVYSSTDSTPEIGELGVTKNENGTGTGAFSEKITGLAQGTKYYVRAYATNIEGTAYGTTEEFTTPTITAAITPENALTEENLNTNSLTVTLSNVTFTDDVLDPASFTLNNAPAGVSIESVEYTDTTHCKVNLAYDDTDFDADATTFSLTIAVAELSEGENLTSGAITIATTVEPAPTVTSLSPRRGRVLGGTSVTIWGTNFTEVTEVWFGDKDAASYIVVSDTKIVAVSPAGSVGTVDVTVTTRGGTSAENPNDEYAYRRKTSNDSDSEDETETRAVTFRDWDGTVLGIQVVEDGEAATPPENPEREGYTFVGWEKEYDEVTGSMSVTAKYTPNTSAGDAYTISFSTSGGSAVETQQIPYDGNVREPEDPTREGYTFGGWYTDSSLSQEYNFGTDITGNQTLYAKWIENGETLPLKTEYGLAQGDTWECVTGDFTMSGISSEDAQITWSSSDPNVIRIEQNGDVTSGIITRPQGHDASVVITATATEGDNTVVQTFLLIVKQEGLSKEETREETGRAASVQSGDGTGNETIFHTTMSDGTKIDYVMLTADTVQKLVEQGDISDSIVVTIGDSAEDPANEYTFEVPSDAVAALSQNGLGVTLESSAGTVALSAEEMKQATQSGISLYFRIVQAKEEAEEAENAFLGDTTVFSIPDMTGKVFGTPKRIETNMENIGATVTLPVKGLSEEQTADEAFLETLCVYVEHSDGTTELVDGTPVYTEDEFAGIQFEINGFSRFQVVSVEEAAATAEAKAPSVWIWIAGAAAGLAVLIVLLLLAVRKKKSSREDARS